MSSKQGGTQKSRKHKVSEGIHGARKTPLKPVELVLLGKGLFQSFAPIGHDRRPAK